MRGLSIVLQMFVGVQLCVKVLCSVLDTCYFKRCIIYLSSTNFHWPTFVSASVLDLMAEKLFSPGCFTRTVFVGFIIESVSTFEESVINFATSWER